MSFRERIGRRARGTEGGEPLEDTSAVRGCFLTLLVIALFFVLSAVALIALALIRDPAIRLPPEFDDYGTPERSPPVELSDLDGLRCVGEWTDPRGLPAGSISAVFAVDPAGDGGSVTLALSQPVLGGDESVTELRFNHDEGTLVIDELDDVLGDVEVSWVLDRADFDATFGAPSGVGGARAVVSGLRFDGSRMSTAVHLDSGEGSVGWHGVDATCSKDPE